MATLQVNQQDNLALFLRAAAISDVSHLHVYFAYDYMRGVHVVVFYPKDTIIVQYGNKYVALDLYRRAEVTEEHLAKNPHNVIPYILDQLIVQTLPSKEAAKMTAVLLSNQCKE